MTNPRAGWRPRQQWLIGGVILLAVGLIAAASFLAGTLTKSPAQVAAEAEPPSASVVTAPLERRVLSEPIVLRGRVMPGASVRVVAPSATVGPDSVITKVNVSTGDALNEGKVIAVCAGRPLIAVVLPFPLYRDITGGETGPDIVEVQRALRRMGYSVSTSGTVDEATQHALGRLFTDRGFTAQPGSAEAVAQLPPAQAAVTAAQQDLDAAVAAGTGVSAAQLRLDEAERVLSGLRVLAGPSLPRSAVVRIDRTGRTITAVPINVGSILSSSETVLVELDGEAPFLVANATDSQAQLLRPAQAATVVVDATTHVAVTVDRVGATVAAPDARSTTTAPAGTVTEGPKLDGVEIRFVAAAGATLPPPGDASYRVDITTNAAATPVLAAPVTAIYSRPDGSSFVTVSRDGVTEDVTVVTGAIAGGWVEITPTAGATLTEGTEVVVGRGGGLDDK